MAQQPALALEQSAQRPRNREGDVAVRDRRQDLPHELFRERRHALGLAAWQQLRVWHKKLEERPLPNQGSSLTLKMR